MFIPSYTALPNLSATDHSRLNPLLAINAEWKTLCIEVICLFFNEEATNGYHSLELIEH